MALKDKLLPQDFASSGPWDGINKIHSSNFLKWCHLKMDIQDLEDVMFLGKGEGKPKQTWLATN